ncbi:MAG TPA: DEAD/DEAH box helicase family protein, partial [Alphaproteobacteria bacterium]
MTPAPASGGGVAVLLPLPLAGTYDYLVGDRPAPPPGSFVRVPLGPRRATGVVWGAAGGDVAPQRLRAIEAVLEVPAMGEALRRFIDWVAGYNLAAPGSVLRMAMSVPAALAPPRPVELLVRGAATPDRLTARRHAVLQAAARRGPLTRAALMRETGAGAGVVQGLVKCGALGVVARTAETDWPAPDPSRPGHVLSHAQAEAARALVAEVAERRFAPTLLDGVTGAGKTETYLEAVAAALAAGRQVLVLLPEIALGAQWLARFETRFGAP